MTEPWQVAEPWRHPDEPLLPAIGREAMVAEREARRDERRREAQRAERAEAREQMLFRSGMEWSAALSLPFDPLRPFTNIPSAQARAEMMEAQAAAETRAAARRALEEAGLPTSLLRSAFEPPPDVPVLSAPPPSEEEIADAELARARRNTERARKASIAARIRRVTGRPS